MKSPTIKVMNDFYKAHQHEAITLMLAEDCELKVTPYLPLYERLAFIQQVVDHCFNPQGELCPEYFDLLFWTTVFQTMSNMPMPKTTGAENEKNVDLKVMHKWIQCLPAEFMNKLDNNNFITKLYFDCQNKIKARESYLQSFAGQIMYMNDNAQDLLERIQDAQNANDNVLAQIETAKTLHDVYDGGNVITLQRDDDHGSTESES